MQMEKARADMIGPDLVLIEVCVRACSSCYECGHDCGVMPVAISIIVIVGNVLLFSRAGRGNMYKTCRNMEVDDMQLHNTHTHTHTHLHANSQYMQKYICVLFN